MTNVREVRESLGLSRQQLADAAGVTVGAVWSVENGRKARDKGAEAKVLAALEQHAAPQTKHETGRREAAQDVEERKPVGRQRYAPPPRSDWLVVTEFNGLQPGDKFTVKGEDGVFTFIRHVTSSRGEWVDGYGGPKGYAGHRSFHPHKVRAINIKRVRTQ